MSTKFAVLALAAASLASCATTNKGNTSPWLAPSPGLERQIAENAERLPWTHGMERVQLIQWFAGVGEPAYEPLIKLAQDDDEGLASASLSALGATRDSRLVPYIREISDRSSSSALKLEHARTLVVLGDWSALPVLIQGLRDKEQYHRALCSKTLIQVTGEDFSFDAAAGAEQREAAVIRWEAWWGRRSEDPMLER